MEPSTSTQQLNQTNTTNLLLNKPEINKTNIPLQKPKEYKKRDCFLAPTPSYQTSQNQTNLNSSILQEDGNKNFAKSPATLPSMELRRTSSMMMSNSFFTSNSPAYILKGNQNTIQYYNNSSNKFSPNKQNNNILNSNESSFNQNSNSTLNNSNKIISANNQINNNNSSNNNSFNKFSTQSPSISNNKATLSHTNSTVNNDLTQNSNLQLNTSIPTETNNQSYLDEEIKPILQNIVSTANLKCKLDLQKIALKAKNAEYNPKRFAAVIMRIKDPKTTALIFASGKMVCTGARSEEASKKAAKHYAKIIKKLGYEDVQFSEFKIQNIVGSCDVRFQISLEGLATYRFTSYEPEIFPGLIFKMLEPKIVLLIFVSGKIVLTGAKHRDEIYKAFENILPILKQNKKIGN